MRKVTLCLLMPALLAAGSMLIGTDRAEARIRVRHLAPRVVVVPRVAHYYHHPRVYVAPRVHLYRPRVEVHVGHGSFVSPYVYPGHAFYGHGSVVAPGVHVHW